CSIIPINLFDVFAISFVARLLIFSNIVELIRIGFDENQIKELLGLQTANHFCIAKKDNMKEYLNQMAFNTKNENQSYLQKNRRIGLGIIKCYYMVTWYDIEPSI
uniref:Uncharacterized protein n=1 Tax=Romanomermis culicivorax TaxID=13658 RepID=A0A915I5D6_ROMCU